MVLRLDPDRCACGICSGGDHVPEGWIGGSYCPCPCHTLVGQRLDDFIEKRKKEREAAMEKLVEELRRKGNPLAATPTPSDSKPGEGKCQDQ